MTFRQVSKVLQRNGFEVVRVSGSHHRFKHVDGRWTIVASHGNAVIPLGTMRAIVRQSCLDDSEWL
ncbi:MAG: type II toxin-antitoxin system HicA family toxin [Thermoleophilia bacterium]|nr:type II toxin-antitoxin system HicA family toxin [Thermoleophilia bacterium]